MSSIMIATSCSAVLILPPSVAAITRPCADAMLRSPLTARSRPTSTTTTQAGTRASATMNTSTAVTISLSASGSRNSASVLTWPRLRASYPSRKSPAAATRYSKLAMNVRSGLKLSMNSSTSGINTTRLIVTRLGRLVTSRRMFEAATPSPPRRIEQHDALALARDLERRRLRVARARHRRGMRNQAPHTADQPRARQQPRAILGHLDRDRRLAQRERDDAAAPELEHAHVGARHRPGLPRQGAVERKHAILAHVQHVFRQRHGQPARRRAGDPDVA